MKFRTQFFARATAYCSVTVLCLLFFVLFTACAPGNDAIANTLQSDLSILDDSIRVSVNNGVVTLQGSVADEATKNAAESVVRDEKGVTAVVNHIIVRREMPPPADTLHQQPAH